MGRINERAPLITITVCMFGKGVGEGERMAGWGMDGGFLQRFSVCVSVLMHRSVPVSLQRGV